MSWVAQNTGFSRAGPPRDGPVTNSYQLAVDNPAAERERLILAHLPQVRLIARRIHERLPDSVSLEDLISTGIVGLISAIDHFDPTHNVKLKTYAEYKIRGAILDSLRGLDWAPRQKRKKAKLIEAAICKAEQRLHRTPLRGRDRSATEPDHGGLPRLAGGDPRREPRQPRIHRRRGGRPRSAEVHLR